MPAGDWAQAGRVSSQRFNNAMTAVAINSVDPNKLIQESMKARSAQKQTAMKAKEALKRTEDRVETFEAKNDARLQMEEAAVEGKNVRRKAGLIAAGASMIAASQMRPPEREFPKFEYDLSGYQKVIDSDRAALERQRGELEQFNIENPLQTPEQPGETTGKAGYSAPASGDASVLGNVDNSSYFDTSKLTDKDFSELAYIVSGEAARGTDDEFGVAASVLNRVQSSQYPNTIEAVGRAPKQYEAVTSGTARYEPELAARLKANVGKINSALETLEGRTDFKGQTMLKNRVAAEDPMFHPSGNFFHYNYQ